MRLIRNFRIIEKNCDKNIPLNSYTRKIYHGEDHETLGQKKKSHFKKNLVSFLTKSYNGEGTIGSFDIRVSEKEAENVVM